MHAANCRKGVRSINHQNRDPARIKSPQLFLHKETHQMQILINPLTPLFLFLLIACLANRFGRKVAGLVFVYLYLCCIPATAKLIGMAWSVKDSYDPQKKYDAALILGGVSDYNWYLQRKEQGKPVLPNYHRFNSNGDRVVSAADLLISGQVEKAIIGDDLGTRPFNETELITDFLTSQGISSEKVEVYGPVRNTFEEGLKVKEYIMKKSVQNVLLITTQNHMRRARAVMHKQGLTMDTLSVTPKKELLVKDFIPKSKSAWLLERIVYEIVGYLRYWQLKRV